MSATATAKVLSYVPDTADKPRTLRLVPAGPICRDCGASAEFRIGAWTFCKACVVRVEVG